MNGNLVRGVAFIAVVVAVGVGTVGLYNESFTSGVDVTLETDRAGLTMDVGSVVKIRGVEIGTVKAVESTPAGAELTLELDRDHAGLVASDAVAQIVPPTAFGTKYVQISPAAAGAEPIAAGGRITADAVTVEINDAFVNLTRLLDAARPTDVNEALSAAATALDTRGEAIGELITVTDAYLAGLNSVTPELADDLRRTSPVVQTYRQALPDLIDTGRNSIANGQLLANREGPLSVLLSTVTGTSDRTRSLVDASSADLRTSVASLAPVTETVARYSSILPCVLEGVVDVNRMVEPVVGGEFPGISTLTRLQPGEAPYTVQDNLPLIGDQSGPNCFGLPRITPADASAVHPEFFTGANPYADGQPTTVDDLSTTLFGLLAGLVNAA